MGVQPFPGQRASEEHQSLITDRGKSGVDVPLGGAPRTCDLRNPAKSWEHRVVQDEAGERRERHAGFAGWAHHFYSFLRQGLQVGDLWL